jgi:hypothetical protein
MRISPTRSERPARAWIMDSVPGPLVAQIKGTVPKEPKPPKAIGAAIDHSTMPSEGSGHNLTPIWCGSTSPESILRAYRPVPRRQKVSGALEPAQTGKPRTERICTGLVVL